MIWHLFWLTVVGGAAGIATKFILTGVDGDLGPVVAGTLGLFGAFAADYVTVRLAWTTQTSGITLVAAIGGAFILVVAYYLFLRIRNAASR